MAQPPVPLFLLLLVAVPPQRRTDPNQDVRVPRQVSNRLTSAHLVTRPRAVG